MVGDQEIEEQYRENLVDLDKVPDIVRCLREFSGNHSEFSSWKKSVERVLNIYQAQKGTPKYFAILNVIRNKIIGAADSALESYNTPLCWEAISRCLTIHYADKRDIGTLEYQLTTLVQGNLSVQEFYQEVYSHLSLIISNINCMTIGREAMEVLIQTYRDKALDTFIRGLRGDLSKLLCIREPNSLPQALHLCLKLQNQNFRTDHALNKNSQTVHKNQNYKSQTIRRSFIPSPVTQRNNQSIHQPQSQYQTYYPNHYPNRYLSQQQYPPYKTFPNTGQLQNFQKQFQNTYPTPPPRPTAPKPLPKPVPMEIDQSIQSRNINYMNRPKNDDRFFGKRPPGSTAFQTQKMQRNYNIITGNSVHNETDYNKEMELYETAEELQPLQEYCDQVSYYEEECQPEHINDQELSDIHFLE